MTKLEWVENIIEHKYLNNTYLINSLIRQNGIIAFGSDFPVEPIDPIKTFYDAVVRKNATGDTKPHLEKEKVDRITALKAMTYWNAMAQFQEKEIGSLEVGKAADFIILSRDIITIPENEIMGTNVVSTFVNGVKK